MRDDADTLEQTGVVSLTPTAAAAAAGDGGEGEEGESFRSSFTQNSRLMLVGSTPAEVEVVLKGRDPVSVRNDLLGSAAVPKGFKRVALNFPAGPSEFSRYRYVGLGVFFRGRFAGVWRTVVVVRLGVSAVMCNSG